MVRNLKLKYMVLCLSGLALTACGNKETAWKLYELEGKAKSVKSICYEAEEKFGELTEGKVVSGSENIMLVNFNEDGLVTDITVYESDGDLAGKNINEFDDGLVISAKQFDKYGSLSGRIDYTYNDDKKVTKQVTYDADGKAVFTILNEYEDGLLVKSSYGGEFSHDTYSLFEYDGSKLVKSVGYNKDGKPDGTYSEYDGDLILKIVGKSLTTTFTYNDKKLTSSVTNGRITLDRAILLEEGESYTYEYEYDDHGSWIRRVERQKDSGKATRIAVRTIEYY